MRRLTLNQIVTISLDPEAEEEDVIECRVRSISGPVALLDCLDQSPDHLRPRLSPGSMCMMAFTHRQTVVGLRGVVTAASDDLAELAFIVADGVQVEERRIAERVPFAARTRIRTVDEHGPAEPGTEAVTANISLTGVLVERREGAGAGPRFQLELFVDPDSAPVRCEAQLARETDTHLGLKFTDIEPLDRIRLARVVAGAARHVNRHRS